MSLALSFKRDFDFLSLWDLFYILLSLLDFLENTLENKFEILLLDFLAVTFGVLGVFFGLILGDLSLLEALKSYTIPLELDL